MSWRYYGSEQLDPPCDERLGQCYDEGTDTEADEKEAAEIEKAEYLRDIAQYD